MNPCIELCWNRYKKQYSSQCDTECDYAKAVLENRELKNIINKSSIRHGKWIDEHYVDDEHMSQTCSVCYSSFTTGWKSTMEFCPDCGAKMDEKD